MDNRNLFELEQTLGRLFQVIQSGSAESVLSEVKALVKQWPSQPDVAHLAALAYKASNDPDRAAQCFKRSLRLDSKQPQVLNNYANFLKSHGDFTAAIRHYLTAISIQANFFDAIRNLALCYYACEDFVNAEQQLKALLNRKSEDLTALTTLANCYRKTGKLELAKEKYHQVLSLNPKHINALYNLGLTHHMERELGEAIRFYRLAYEQARTDEILISLATTLNELGARDESISLLGAQLNLNPRNVSLHESLNDILWEAGLTSEFGRSYRKAISDDSATEDIYVSYISQLLMIADLEKAEVELERALLRFGKSPRLLDLKARKLADQGKYSDAYEAFAKSLQIAFSTDTAQQAIKLCIIMQRYKEAQVLLDQVFEELSECQLNWALQGLVWRLTNDTRADWLNNYTQFIRVYEIPKPDGYRSLDEYLAKLKAVLLRQHLAEREPLRQTLKLGTQTSPRLFYDKSIEIRELVAALSGIVTRYISELPDDNDHPFLCRKSTHFEFSGSWSVKLKANGFHVNHVHPEGWISSSCYISLPRKMRMPCEGAAGAIKFGESSLSLAERELVAKVLMPKKGEVVLFPSYFWHGTLPFKGDDEDFRLTTPFDVIPI